MKFLVCLDNTESSLEAFNSCVSMMKKNEDEVYLISVIDDYYLGEGFIDVSSKKEKDNYDSRMLLHRYGDYCKNQNLNATLLLGHGSTNSVISEEIVKRAIDVVVCGRREKTVYQRMISGSTSKYLVENSNCTVMIARERGSIKN